MLNAAMDREHIARRHIRVRGIVQGVGFRPFVYKLAESFSLTGHVFNSSSGVTIEIEGATNSLDRFERELRTNPPALAEVKSVVVEEIAPAGDRSFSILQSQEESGAFALVPPDSATCDACWQETGDRHNRRFGYPFTNCTHCGPRYTIIKDVPYDRALTTMAEFTMCAACADEYNDPKNRRFHAQPNACATCGPSLALLPRGHPVSPDSFQGGNSLDVVRQARALLRDGRILAVRGLGGFLLACDGSNETAVAELRRRKRRPSKPFALMVRDLAALTELCDVSPAARAALIDPRRPIVILPRLASAPVAGGIAPGNNSVGVMLPYTPLHYLLFSDSPEDMSEFHALVMTSGNLSDEPIILFNEEALVRLDGVADWFLLHNRRIHTRVDDSVVRILDGQPSVIRRARGYVPQAIDMGRSMNEVLAFGAELKNTFCLTKGSFAILSQHIGDLENYETEQFFNETLSRIQHLFKFQPCAVAHDLHPGYRSTRLALRSSIERKFPIQHHHAHIASCMAENHLEGEVLGVAFDGTGLGTDGCIWGGEFFAGGYAKCIRYAHLRYVPLPGGDAAVRQPWRMALSYLRDAYGSAIPSDLRWPESVPAQHLRIVDAMLEKGIQTVNTSSAGRLFDAVSCLLGLTTEMTFEAEGAIALENAAAPGMEASYSFDLIASDPLIIDLRPAIVSIVDELRGSRSIHQISAQFHNTIAAVIVEVCSLGRTSHRLNRVCLSGGTFQNLYLLHRTVVELRRRGFDVFVHSTAPANDGGISLGQAVIAHELLRTKT